jgi:hypothetical protein
MKIKIAILLSAMISILICCKTSDKIPISNNLIEKIAKEDQAIPSQYSNLNLFIQCEDNKIAMINVHYLREFYRSSHHNSDYETFLKSLLNQSVRLDCKNVSNKFELDSSIYAQYDKIGLKPFLSSYCKQIGVKIYNLNKDLSENKTKTVLYILFINNYMSAQDDYLGMTVVRKIE